MWATAERQQWKHNQSGYSSYPDKEERGGLHKGSSNGMGEEAVKLWVF
jgi:hypothetical protein